MLRQFVQRLLWQLPARLLVGRRGGAGVPPPRHRLGTACCEAPTYPVSHALRRHFAAAAAAGSGEVGTAAAASADGSSGPTYQDWRGAWLQFLDFAYSKGHYAADPGVPREALDSSPGAMKRAVLSLARQRGDILHSLDHAKLAALVKAGFPTDDRKTKNAHRRLQATILDGQDLPSADGGPAELQDVARLLLSLAACDPREARLFRPLIAAALALLPDITAAAQQPPAPSVAAQGTQRYMPSKREPGEAAAPKLHAPRRTVQGSSSSSSSRPPARQPRQQQQEKDDEEGLERGGKRWFERRGSGSSSGRPQGRGDAGGGRRGGGRGSAGRGGARNSGRGPRQQSRRDDGSGIGQDMGWWYSGGKE